MIDLHCHLLPGLDDGPLTWEESLEMARTAAKQGVRAIVATPHHANGRYDNPSAEVKESVGRLNRALLENRIPLTVYPGQEIRIYPNLLDDLEQGKLLPLGESRYLLLELPDEWSLSALMDLFYELKLMGYVPVIAHPERHLTLVRNSSLMAEFVEFGAIGQVTSHSLLGKYGNAIRRCALHMCREGMIHLLSSDAHRPRIRGYEMDAAYRTIEREVGSEFAQTLRENSRKALRNEPLGAARHLKKQRKAWFI
ncbi:tyrosine protein phosphatase [Cohnella xylanilytica]|uniref:Tyrosine-protein phosphatase n=1 Tax=Cohnella xylanilytica TaxID=557555 RepID=A0A841U0F4_9BACL|nr:CpsB/CapC family capsule biosynthesis tyrosine phosphatase [Cohnella xylanilytica]MBB6692872.1 tyrosine protein phosphatase [Cohnella xylanilytica]